MRLEKSNFKLASDSEDSSTIAMLYAHTVSAPEGIPAQTDSSEEDLYLFANC